MTKTEILQDLDYVKTLAEEGKNTPLLGGNLGIWWGCLLVVTLFIHFSSLKGSGPIPIQSIGLVWIVFAVVGIIGSAIFGRRLNHKPGASSMNNRVANALWIGNSILLFTYGFSAGLSAGFGRISFDFMDTMIPIAFGLYGLTAFVLAQISHEKWQMIPGFVALAFVPIGLFLLGRPELYLAAIFGVICTIIIPGIIHMRNEPKAVV